MNAVRISVITICKNAGSTLERTIQSIVQQDGPDIEYIIIDGASTDDSLQIIDRYREKIASLTSEADNGISDAFNKGLSRATGELVIFINADDQLTPGALAQVAADWEELDRPDVLCGATRYLDPATGASFKETPNLEYLHRYMSIFHPSMVATREAYERVGPYREDYKIAMDCEWVHRALHVGQTFKAVDRAYSVMSLQGVSDVQFRRGLREFRRSARENGIYRFTTDFYCLQQLLFKSLMRIRLFKALKYRLDSRKTRKEWSGSG